MQEEAAFPRGRFLRKSNETDDGDSSKKGRKRSHSAPREGSTHDDDLLFGERRKATIEKSKSSSKKRRMSTGSSVVGSSSVPTNNYGGYVSFHKRHKKHLIESLSFQKLSKGTKLLGCIKQVCPDFCLVSLPNQLTGYILPQSSKSTNDDDGDEDDPLSLLTNMVQVGQMMAVYVVKATMEKLAGGQSRKRIQVSIDPQDFRMTNEISTSMQQKIRGQIVSIEDHGLLVRLGMGAVKGFVKFEDIDGDYTLDGFEESNNGKKHYLHEGRILDFTGKVDGKKSSDTTSSSVIPLRVLSHFQLAKDAPTISSFSKMSLSTLLPGTLVQTCKVVGLAKNGLLVTFGVGGLFHGAVDVAHVGSTHIPTTKNQDGWSSSSKEAGKKSASAIFETVRTVAARIIAVDPRSKLLRLSLEPHILTMEPILTSPAQATTGGDISGDHNWMAGHVLKSATVVRVDPGVGVWMAWTNEKSVSKTAMQSDSWAKLQPSLAKESEYTDSMGVRLAYVHISKASDDIRMDASDLVKTFAPSTQHDLRLLSDPDPFTGVATAATAPSIVDAHVLSHADLVPGAIYRGVPSLGPRQGGAVTVDFGMGVRGLIPAMHLFDTVATNDYRTKLMKEKYTKGQKVDVRVLEVDLNRKRCLVTAKKSLVQDSSNVITSFSSVKIGDEVTGFVSKVDREGVYITFYNGVFGRVTARSLAADLAVEDHRQNYHVGDVLTCRVISKRKRNGQRDVDRMDEGDGEDGDNGEDIGGYWNLDLSLNLNEDGAPEDSNNAATPKSERRRQIRLNAGAILPPKTMKIVQFIPSVEKGNAGYIPGHVIVRIKTKHLVKDERDSQCLPYVECKLPFDQLSDTYNAEQVEAKEGLDSLAKSLLTVGKKINQKGMVLTDPKRSNDEYHSGIGKMPVVTLRSKLIERAEAIGSGEDDSGVIMPTPESDLFMGALVLGYVAQVDPRHGAFVRFMDGMTGLVPKLKKGLHLPRYETVTCKIVAIDVTCKPMKILLKHASLSSVQKTGLKVGDRIDQAEVLDVSFSRATIKILDGIRGASKMRARIHVSMAASEPLKGPTKVRTQEQADVECNKQHPFHKWSSGMRLSDLTCVAVDDKNGSTFVELSNTDSKHFLESPSQLRPGRLVSGTVTGVSKSCRGVWVQLSPGVTGFVPALEVSTDPQILNDLRSFFPLGACLKVRVIDSDAWQHKLDWGRRFGPSQQDSKQAGFSQPSQVPVLSLLLAESNKPTSDSKDQDTKGTNDAKTKEESKAPIPDDSDSSWRILKPRRGDLVVGRICHSIRAQRAPALMVELRGGFIGRCCVTELEEMDDWDNMPLGKNVRDGSVGHQPNIVTDEEEEDNNHSDAMDLDGINEDEGEESDEEEYRHGRFVACRVLNGVPRHPMVEVSLRESRLEGDLDEDELPEPEDIIQAYVVNTNKKGCFVRLSRYVEGRVLLNELTNSFLPDPAASFPPGRLVVGQVKSVKVAEKKKHNKHHASVDLDMRETSLIDANSKLTFETLEVGSKHKGTITRIEDYGVFVRLHNSEVTGLAHKSECSDAYVKSMNSLYDPGDLVKVFVVKKDDKKKQVGFSLKASHFEGDIDSDDDEDDDDDDDVSMEEEDDDRRMEEIDSDDEEFVSKLATKHTRDGNDDDDDNGDGSDDGDSSDNDSSDDSESISKDGSQTMDANVGFSWNAIKPSKTNADGADQSSDDDDDDDQSDDEGDMTEGGKSRKSRKKAAERRREEKEISKRELALADGTADQNPESPADFERLLASEPNNSEHWIRYMAYYLSVADMDASRRVADRAFDRIEFSQETEKLNVWTALLTMELKYGENDKSFQACIDRACQQNNPKQVYLRVCEILEKEVDSSGGTVEATKRAEDMFEKMCKKFKDKKTVWIAHLTFLLKSGRHQEAHALSKRALTSLPQYKHLATMSKLAQLEFEFGSIERGRTVFDGLLSKYRKRLDLLFVYVDKEVKAGEIQAARAIFEKAVADENSKLSEKQMKSLFKKWYRIEEAHGDSASRDHVKDEARAFVQRSTK